MKMIKIILMILFSLLIIPNVYGATIISACRVFTSADSNTEFLLDTDLSVNSGTCFEIQDVENLILNLGGTINNISVTGATKFIEITSNSYRNLTIINQSGMNVAGAYETQFFKNTQHVSNSANYINISHINATSQNGTGRFINFNAKQLANFYMHDNIFNTSAQSRILHGIWENVEQDLRVFDNYFYFASESNDYAVELGSTSNFSNNYLESSGRGLYIESWRRADNTIISNNIFNKTGGVDWIHLKEENPIFVYNNIYSSTPDTILKLHTLAGGNISFNNFTFGVQDSSNGILSLARDTIFEGNRFIKESGTTEFFIWIDGSVLITMRDNYFQACNSVSTRESAYLNIVSATELSTVRLVSTGDTFNITCNSGGGDEYYHYILLGDSTDITFINITFASNQTSTKDDCTNHSICLKGDVVDLEIINPNIITFNLDNMKSHQYESWTGRALYGWYRMFITREESHGYYLPNVSVSLVSNDTSISGISYPLTNINGFTSYLPVWERIINDTGNDLLSWSIGASDLLGGQYSETDWIANESGNYTLNITFVSGLSYEEHISVMEIAGISDIIMLIILGVILLIMTIISLTLIKIPFFNIILGLGFIVYSALIWIEIPIIGVTVMTFGLGLILYNFIAQKQ